MTLHFEDADAGEAQGIAGCLPAMAQLRAEHAGCPPVRMLAAARAGALPADQQRDVEAHLDTCHTCRTAADDFALVVSSAEWPAAAEDALLRRIRRATAPAGQRAAWLWWPAFGAVTLSLLVLMWRWPNSRGETPPTPAAANRPPVVPAAPAAPPAFALAFSTPAVKLTLGALTWRSEGQDNASYLEALRPGLDAYRTQHYADAASSLDAVAQRHPGAIEPRFYAAISYLHVRQPARAVVLLRDAGGVDDPVFDEDVEWYLSVALQHAGEHAQARSRLETSCRSAGAHARDACEALRAWGAAASDSAR